MLISASRRTDIPAYYAEWFCNRIREGYVLVRNPRNARQISRIPLRPDQVDGIVFWTKNPLPMLNRLHQLAGYAHYFQCTLNAYGQDVEPGVPPKERTVIPAFQRLSDQLGPDRVLWRYDPIFLNATYTMAHHLRYFEVLARRLSGYTTTCTISFLDSYRSTAKSLASLGVPPISPEQQTLLAQQLAAIARSHGMQLYACAEAIDLRPCGVLPARCIDGSLFARLSGRTLNVARDRNQRPACNCAESVDIGAYNTCRGGCRYCYATSSPRLAAASAGLHDPQSPLLVGEAGPEDVITDRKTRSCPMTQLKLRP